MKTLIVICLFAVAVLIFFADAVFGPHVLLDASPYAFHPWQSHASPEDLQYETYRMDGLLTYLPRQVELSRSFRSGRFPLWNPYIYAGIPFFADPQTQALYPITAALAWTDPVKALGYSVAIHVLIALIGMYLFLRVIGLSTPGAVVGAFAYGFSSYFYSRLGQPTFVASASWIPFFFYAYERSRTSERTATILLIVFLALGYLAGFPQIFMLGVAGLVIYAVALNVDRLVTKESTDWLRSARVLAVGGICSMLLVSVQLVPFLEFTKNAVGLNIEFEQMRDVYLSPPILLVKSLFPDFFGNPVDGTDWSGLMRESVHPYNPDFVVYCGIGCILVAVGGLAFVRQVRRMRAFIVLLLLSVGLATSPLILKIAYVLVPVFRYSRVARAGVLGCFALAALGGLTISMLSREPNGNSRGRFVGVFLTALAVVVMGSLVFMTIGDTYIDRMSDKANALGPEFWRSALAQLRSGGVREWAEGQTSEWFAYVRGRLVFGVAFAALASIAVSVYAWPRKLGANPRRIALAVFVILLLLDLGLVSRGYFVTQPSGDFPEVDGIGVLRHLLGSPGRWRTRSVSYSPEYVSTLPGNANQILKIHSLEGTSTIVPSNYYEGLFKSFKDSVIPLKLRKSHLPSNPEEIRLGDLAGVRYVAAEGTELPYVTAPIFTTIMEGLAGRETGAGRLRFLSLGDDDRLALHQNVNEALTFALTIPGVSRLDFAVGFESSGGTMGDSLTFLLMLEGRSGKVEFARGFDLLSDRARWHDLSLDISEIGDGRIKGAIGVVSSAAEAQSGVKTGWSGLDLVYGNCDVVPVSGGYSIGTARNNEFAVLTIRSDAREIPITITDRDGGKRTRWIGFPPHLLKRDFIVDLAEAAGETILIESDSAFTLDGARLIHLGSVYPDYRLIHDSDMHIYENLAAVEKGICIDRIAVATEMSGVGSRLRLSALEEVSAARCGRSSIISYEPEKVVLEVAADRDCYLLFQDMYYPGWKAYVDSEPSPFITSDVGFRVLEVPEGEHTVMMEFRPGSLRIGFVLTCLGLSLTLVFAHKTRSHPRQGGSEER